MGPVYIGKNVHIRDSIIGPFSTIADNCIIDDSELQEVVTMEQASIFNSQIVSSIIFKESTLSNTNPVINKLHK